MTEPTGAASVGTESPLKANARMYDVCPVVAGHWRALFALVARHSGVPLEVLAHPAPNPVEALWARRDLGCVLMCGWPFWRASPRPEPIVAPVIDAPSPDNFGPDIVAPDNAGPGGGPGYWSDMIVRAEANARTLEDTFGGTLAWTVEGSHSGYNAPRYLLLEHFRRRTMPLYTDVVPNVVTPRGAIEAVLSGRADVAPLDGYFHMLLRRHEPETAARIRVVARTPVAPMPLFTASHGTEPEILERLRAAMVTLHQDAAAADTLRALAIRRFVRVDPQDYALGDRWQAEARAAGYPAPA